MVPMDLSCPASHVWFITLSTNVHLYLKCEFCGEDSKVNRFGGLRPRYQFNEINRDPLSRRDPALYPVIYDNVKYLLKEDKNEETPESNPFAE